MGILQKLIDSKIQHCIIQYEQYTAGIKGPAEFAIISCIYEGEDRLRNLGFKNEYHSKKFLMIRVLTKDELCSLRNLIHQRIYLLAKSTEAGRVYEVTGKCFRKHYDKYYFEMYDMTFTKRLTSDKRKTKAVAERMAV